MDFHSSLDGLSWEIEPADADTMKAHEARSACWLRLTTPDNLPEGTFSDWLQFRAEPLDAPSEGVEHEIAVAGKTLKRLAVYGAGIDAQGLVSFGSVTEGVGAKRRLLMKVRDRLTELPVRTITTTPEFLEVRVVRSGTDTSKGLLQLEIEIPPNAPRSNYLGVEPGAIRIEFDHPRIRQLELNASFAVVPSAAGG